MIMNIRWIALFLLIMSCQNNAKIPIKNTNKYAQLFRIDLKKDSTFLYTYSGNKEVSKLVLTEVPKRIVLFSSSQLGFIKSLHLTKKIVGVSDKNYFYDESIAKEEILQLGDEDKLNLELLIALKPDLVFLLPSLQPNQNTLNLLKKAHIPFLITTDFKESNPLATAEWIKFYGAIFNESKVSDSIFSTVESNYNTIKNKTSKTKIPIVMTGFPWQNQWFVSGNNSYLATLIHDAGGMYFYDKKLNNNVQLSHEEVLKYGSKATFWVNISDITSRNSMEQNFSLSKNMPSYINDQCYNNINKVQSNGANDYWEIGVVRPDWILSDLHQIFTQKENPNFIFYQKLK